MAAAVVTEQIERRFDKVVAVDGVDLGLGKARSTASSAQRLPAVRPALRGRVRRG
jgi:hypothetical protein